MNDNIIFVYPHKSTFIELDISILQEKYNVIENTYDWNNKYKVPLYLIQQFFFFLFNIKKLHHIVISFGGIWAFAPVIIGKIFNKKVSIILHGTDCSALEEFNYGILRKPFQKMIIGFCYRNVTQLLPVSEALIYTENNFSNKTIKQGLHFFFPGIKTPIKVIYNGIDVNFWKIDSNLPRENKKVLSVISEGQFYLKGVDLIVETASLMPDYNFYIVGMKQSKRIKSVPNNIHFLGRLTSKELYKIYNTSSVYLQTSILEGFGCSLCEAMSCGCQPIVSNVGIMPKIIKDNDFVLNKRDPKRLKELIQNKSEQMKPKDIEKGAKIIKDNFSLKKRCKQLLEAIN